MQDEPVLCGVSAELAAEVVTLEGVEAFFGPGEFLGVLGVSPRCESAGI